MSNIVQIKSRERDYTRHLIQIHSIKKYKKNTQIKLNKKSKKLNTQESLMPCRSQSSSFRVIERQNKIVRENKILMANLVQIGDGKRSQFRSIWEIDQKDEVMRANTSIVRSSSTNRGGLNSPIRRKELQRIEEENYTLAQRIISSGSSIKKPNHSSSMRLPPMNKSKIANKEQSQDYSLSNDMQRLQTNQKKLDQLVWEKQQNSEMQQILEQQERQIEERMKQKYLDKSDQNKIAEHIQ